MSRIEKINSYAPSKFDALLSSDELMQVNGNTVSVISCRSGFCRNFYFLQQAPRAFYFNPLVPQFVVFVYPAIEEEGECLEVIGSTTGKVIRRLCLKNPSHFYCLVSIGASLAFTVSTSKNYVYSMPVEEGPTAMYEAPVYVHGLFCHPSTQQFIVTLVNGTLILVNSQESTHISKSTVPEYDFFVLNEDSYAVGTKTGEILIVGLEDSSTKTISVPHGVPAADIAGNFILSMDGTIFETQTLQAMAHVYAGKQIFVSGPTLATVSSEGVIIYEYVRHPIFSSSEMQPPEPFTQNEFYCDQSIYFASTHAIFSFNIGHDENTKFTSLQNLGSVSKIVSSQAVTSFVTGVNEKHVVTFVTGTKKRDELGIDCCTDSRQQTWILSQTTLDAFQRKQISIEQSFSIQIPTDKGLDTVFRFRDTVAVYSSATGDAFYLKDRDFVPFKLQPDATLIKWPAVCFRNHICIYQENEGIPKKHVVVKASVNSGCWFASTFFAVEHRHVLAIGRHGNMRVVDLLPNAMSGIAAVMPDSLLFVTTVPDLRVIYIKRPVLIDAIGDLKEDEAAQSRFLSFLPPIGFNPNCLSNLSPRYAISILAKLEPSVVTSDILRIYARFGMFNQLFDLVQKKGNESIKRETASLARKYGQFEIARILYESVGDYQALYELFVIANNQYNIGVLSSRTGYRQFAEARGIPVVDGEYKPLPNIPLPQTAAPIGNSEFSLFNGDPSSAMPLFSPLFDEPSDFGFREVPLTGEEQEELAIEEPSPEPELPLEPTEPIAYAEKPPEIDKPPETSLTLTKFFDDDEDESSNTPELKIEIKVGGGGNRRGRHTRFNLSLDNDKPGTAPPMTRRRSATTSVRKGDVPDLSSAGKSVNVALPQEQPPQLLFGSESVDAPESLFMSGESDFPSQDQLRFQSNIFADLP